MSLFEWLEGVKGYERLHYLSNPFSIIKRRPNPKNSPEIMSNSINKRQEAIDSYR